MNAAPVRFRTIWAGDFKGHWSVIENVAHLKDTPDDESALTYLNQTHAKYLPDSLYDGSDNGTNEDDED